MPAIEVLVDQQLIKAEKCVMCVMYVCIYNIERMDATNHRLYRNVSEYSRLLHANSSPFSKYNSGMINMTY